MSDPVIPTVVRQAMLNLARSIRGSSRRQGVGFYDDEVAQASRAAVRNALEEVADCIDDAFGFESRWREIVDDGRDEDSETP